MAPPLTLAFHLWLLLWTTCSSLVQAQYSYSEACKQACIDDRLYQPDVGDTYNFCTTQVYEDFSNCFCRECPPSDLSEVNRLISNFCSKENLAPIKCSGQSASNSTPSSSSTSSSSSSSSRAYTSTSSPTSITGANSNSDDSSSGSSSSSSSSSGGRRGSKSGVKAGISVGVVVGIFLILGLLYFVIGRWKYNKLQKEKAAQLANVGAAGDPSPQPPAPYQQQVNSIEKPNFVPNQTNVYTGYPIQPTPQAYHEMPVGQPGIPQQPQGPHGDAAPRWGENLTTQNNGWAQNR